MSDTTSTIVTGIQNRVVVASTSPNDGDANGRLKHAYGYKCKKLEL